jgi:phospholipid transport system substrate-binding protein
VLFLRRGSIRTAGLTVALLVLACSPAFAGAPTERLRDFFGKVNGILADPATEGRPLERVARIRRLVNDVADMRGAAASALGPFWETRTPAERDEFTTLFAEMIERAYVGRLAGVARSGGGLAAVYLGEQVTGDAATVTTQLRGSGHDLRVEYRMIQQGSRWRVRDIVLDGVSIIDNYRAQFRRLSQSGSHATLVTQMRAKLAEDSFFFAKSGGAHPVAAVAVAPEPTEAAPVALAAELEPRPVPTVSVAPSSPPRMPAPPARDIKPRVTERVAAAPSRPVARPAVVAAVAPVVPVVSPPPPAPAATGWFPTGLWIAILSVLVGGGIVYLGWRAPTR